MKILLTGATGYVGSEILKQCLDHNYIVRIYCLTRKPLEQHWFQHKNGEKITEMLHEDYENYPEAILRRLKDEGVEGCIWALGGNSIAQYKSLDEARRVGINYPIQCAEALARDVATGLSPQNMPKKKFPFRVSIAQPGRVSVRVTAADLQHSLSSSPAGVLSKINSAASGFGTTAARSRAPPRRASLTSQREASRSKDTSALR